MIDFLLQYRVRQKFVFYIPRLRDPASGRQAAGQAHAARTLEIICFMFAEKGTSARSAKRV